MCCGAVHGIESSEPSSTPAILEVSTSMRWKDICQWSHSQRAIWKGAGLIAVSGLIAAIIVSGKWSQTLADYQIECASCGVVDEPTIEIENTSPGALFDYLILTLRHEGQHVAPALRSDVEKLHAENNYSESVRQYAEILLQHGYSKKVPEALTDLVKENPPPQWSHRVLASYYVAHNKIGLAIQSLHKEITYYPDNTFIHRKLYDWTKVTGNIGLLADIATNPHINTYFSNYDHVRVAVYNANIPDMFYYMFQVEFTETEPLLAGLALIGGLIWIIVFYMAGQGVFVGARIALLVVSAFLLGVLSTWLTIFTIVVTEDIYQFKEGFSSFSQTVYMIAGVALREELLKLLCFLPLIPFIIKQNNQLVWLLLASIVGLGFAVEENVGYMAQYGGTALGSRFATANILHFALTGLVGLSVCQAIKWPQTHGQHALTTLILAVLFHGGYNALQTAPLLRPYSFLYIAVLAMITYHYFATLNGLRENRPAMSLTASFCWGFVLILMLNLVLMSGLYGFQQGLRVGLPELMTTVVLVIMVLRGINEPLRP